MLGVNERIELFDGLKLIWFKGARFHDFSKEKGKFPVHIGMYLFFQVSFIKNDEAGIGNLMPFKLAEVAGVGKIYRAGGYRKSEVVDGVLSISVFDEKEAEEIGAVG